MKNIVIYATQTGNTKKVADAIAAALHCKTMDITKQSFDNVSNYNTVFLGSGVYGNKLHPKLIAFLKTNDLKNVENIAFFLTWFGRGKSHQSAFNQGCQLLQIKNLKINANFYACFGAGFRFFRKGHPNEQDIKKAQNWAKEVVK